MDHVVIADRDYTDRDGANGGGVATVGPVTGRCERKARLMKVVITGSRGITDFSLVETAMRRSGLEGKITQVALRGTSGLAPLDKQYADEHAIPLRRFDPIWNPRGRRDNRAELTRDEDLAQYADAAVVVWDRKSAENQHLIRTMVGLGKETHVYDQNGDVVSETAGCYL